MADPSSYPFRRAFVLGLIAASTFAFFYLIRDFLEALLLAAIFSGLLYPIYDYLRDGWGDRPKVAAVTTILLGVFIVVIPLLFLIDLIVLQAIDVSETVAPWIEQEIDEVSDGEITLPEWLPFRDELEPRRREITSKLRELAGHASDFLAGQLGRLVEGTAILFLEIFVMLYAMFFFLLHGPKLVERIMGYFPLSEEERARTVKVGLSVSRATLKGTFIIGLLQGLLNGIAFAVIGIDAAAFWGAIMAVLSVVPGIGPALVWGPAIAWLGFNGQVAEAVGLFIWSSLLVGSLDNVLRPILIGRDTQMPDLLIMLSTLGGLAVFGASGLVLGPMVAAFFLTALAIYAQVFADRLRPDAVAAALPAPAEDPPTEDPPTEDPPSAR